MDILNSFRKRQIAHRTTTLKTKTPLDKEIKRDVTKTRNGEWGMGMGNGEWGMRNGE